MSLIKKMSALAMTTGMAVAFGPAVASEERLATIERVDGTVMVSDGARYIEASAGINLRDADRILTLDDSNATIRFRDGCEYSMRESELLIIGPESACVQASAKIAAAPAAEMQLNSPDYVALERGALSQLAPADDDDDRGGFFLWGGGDGGALILGGIGVGAIVALLGEGTGSDDASRRVQLRTQPRQLPTPSP